MEQFVLFGKRVVKDVFLLSFISAFYIFPPAFSKLAVGSFGSPLLHPASTLHGPRFLSHLSLLSFVYLLISFPQSLIFRSFLPVVLLLTLTLCLPSVLAVLRAQGGGPVRGGHHGDLRHASGSHLSLP